MTRILRHPDLGRASVVLQVETALSLQIETVHGVERLCNMDIVEDQPGGVNDDIWFARDLDQDGDLTDPGEGIGRWASNGTRGSEFTGLYFDPMNKRRAWVNIQQPDGDNDRTIEITIP